MEVPEIDLGNGSKGVDWHPFAESLKADPEVGPYLDKIPEKDMTSLIKSHAHLSKRMGSAINLPAKDAKPEDVQSFKTRLSEAGYLPAVPATPEDYALTAPAELPAGVTWNDELAKTAATTFHQLGLSKEQAGKLVEFHTQMMGQMQAPLLAEYETGMAALKKDWAENFDANAELAVRANLFVFGDDPKLTELFDRTGINNDPRFLKVMHKVGKMLEQDNGFIATSTQPDAALAEAKEIISNPAHAKHAQYIKEAERGVGPVWDEVQAAYKKAHPGVMALS